MKKGLIILAVLLLTAGGIIGLMAANNLSLSSGRCLVLDDGTVMLILDSSPIVMSGQGGDGMFEGLSDGDEILVLHDGIQESYPGATGAYFILRLGTGSMEDIPEDVIRSLKQMGWFS